MPLINFNIFRMKQYKKDLKDDFLKTHTNIRTNSHDNYFKLEQITIN